MQVRKIEKLKAMTPDADTFKVTALEWYEMKLSEWSSHYAIREKRNLEKDLFPFFGARRVSDIQPIELLAAVRQVEERGALDVAHRVLTTAGQVWRYAVAKGGTRSMEHADSKIGRNSHAMNWRMEPHTESNCRSSMRPTYVSNDSAHDLLHTRQAKCGGLLHHEVRLRCL